MQWLSAPFYALRELARCQGSGDISLFFDSRHCFRAWKDALLSATTMTCLKTLPRELRKTKLLLVLEAQLRTKFLSPQLSTHHGPF